MEINVHSQMQSRVATKKERKKIKHQENINKTSGKRKNINIYQSVFNALSWKEKDRKEKREIITTHNTQRTTPKRGNNSRNNNKQGHTNTQKEWKGRIKRKSGGKERKKEKGRVIERETEDITSREEVEEILTKHHVQFVAG